MSCPGFRIEFGSETTVCGFHIVNIWLVHLTRGLISLVTDNHVDNILKEILVYVYLGWIVKSRLKMMLMVISAKQFSYFSPNEVITLPDRTLNTSIRKQTG